MLKSNFQQDENNKLNLLYIITGLGMGGAEQQVCLLADKMVNDGHNVMIISLTGETIVKPRENITIKNLNMGKSLLGLLSSLLKVKKIVKEFSPDVVHSHMFHANIFSRFLRILVKIPCLVCTAHNTNEGNKFRMLMYRWTDKLASISTNVSKEAVDIFIHKGASFPGRMIAIPNGIDIDRFKYSPETRFFKRNEFNINDNIPMLLSVGRLTEAKDYPNLLYAYSLLLKNKNTFGKSLLYIVGVGHLQSELETLVESLNIKDNVHFLGIRTDVFELMCAADIFILSSAWEGFGLVVAEAMACERVIVATDSGGVKEVVGDCGELVPVKDNVALSEAILKMLMLSDAEKRVLGVFARERIIKNNSIDNIVNKWLNIYNGQYD
ncbi:WbcN protein [Yersinia thracica]|uniref:WbcN protein n=1 Tax=Yersinia thracica TaxID=2890319 RepID=A0A0T9NMY3_9GAMM|nr:WbcN protein [Yersinia thracica]